MTLERKTGEDPAFPLDLTADGAMPPLVPDSDAMRSLLSENLRLRDLVVSLSATLLRNVAREAVSAPAPSAGSDTRRLAHSADNCLRCARLLNRKSEIASSLEVAGYEFMAESLRIEARLLRKLWKSRTAS